MFYYTYTNYSKTNKIIRSIRYIYIYTVMEKLMIIWNNLINFLFIGPLKSTAQLSSRNA